MIELKEEFNSDFIAKMMKEADFDHDGKVTFKDFKKIKNENSKFYFSSNYYTNHAFM